MNDDLISRGDLINAKPEFRNEKIVRDTKYRTAKDRIYARAWNACNSYWLNTIKNAPTVESTRPQGAWIPQGGGFSWVFKCSCCSWVDGYPLNERHKYCPNCGAEMKDGAE